MASGASTVANVFTGMQMGGSSEDEDAIPAAAAAPSPAVAAAERGKPTGALALAPAPDRTLAPGWERWQILCFENIPISTAQPPRSTLRPL